LIAYLSFIGSLFIIFASAHLASASIQGRILSLVAVMLGATLVVSGSLRLVPGDPITHILGDQAQMASRELLAKDLHLVDENGQKLSFVAQYHHFLSSLAHLDMPSFISRRNAFIVVAERLPYSLALGFSAMAIAIVLGPFLGIMASLFRNRWPDHLISVAVLAGISIPSFFLGPLLLLLFSVRLHLLPIGGADDGLWSLILPSLAMGLALAAMLARMSRASMLEVLSEDFVRTAAAKGLSPFVIFFKHALRNALIPVITIIGMQFGAVLAGTVITEKIFNWPGIGLLLLESIQRLDMPLVQVCVLVIAFIYALINLLTDIVYSLVDPRIHIGEAKR
jgi:ABC-type dipeptide/oligopeptide/nickel transport system permease component